jgi:outer membrane protein OmpA-like peptidoglycan-associated protein
VLFDTGRAELKSGADRQLDTVANFLEQNPERHVLIEGFTDSVGTEDYNRGLSERRAEAVRSALLSRGVDAGRIQVRGYGEEFPVGTNADAGGRQLNRRVEVIVSNGDQPVEPRARL